MSRPVKPHPTINRKEWMENHLVNRRNHEDAVRSSWKTTAKYFQAWDVKAKKYAELTSPESYHTSMNAYVEKKRHEEQEKMLNSRRQKLAHLLQEENDKYQVELKALLDRRYHKASIAHVAKPETPRPIVPLSPFHTDVESPARSLPVDAACEVPLAAVDRGATASSRAESPLGNRNGNSSRTALPTAVRLEASTTPRAVESPGVCGGSAARSATPAVVESGGSSAECRCKKEAPLTRRQMEDLVETMQWKEREASALKHEHATLHHALEELQRLSQQRMQLDKREQHLEPTNRGNKLRQPYKVQIQKRSHVVQHLMEFDLKFVETMLSIARLIDDWDPSLSDDLGQIHMRIMQNLKIERQELLQSECLFHEEAECMWNRKVDEWEEEQLSRAALIEKTKRLIEVKVEARVAANLERQHGNITSRENVFRAIDAGNDEQPKKSSPSTRAMSVECPEEEGVAMVERLAL